MAPSVQSPRLTPLGLGGVLVTFADGLDDAANRAAIAFRAAIEREEWDGVTETATSLSSAYLSFDPAAVERGTIEARLRDLATSRDWSAEAPAAPRCWIIPCSFEGDHAPQLAEAADLAGLTPEEAIGELTAKPLRALALGYAPGQPYMGFLPNKWDIPRQKGLTPKVPAGAIVVAVRQAIIFTAASTTGWRQVGLTRFRPFRPEDEDDPIPLSPGDEIHLKRVSPDDLDTEAHVE